ncbi:hypothetical protein [Phormidium nigroviride]
MEYNLYNSSSPSVVTIRTTVTGAAVFGVKHPKTDNRVLSSPSSAPKKTANGSDGISDKDKDEIIKSAYHLITTYGYERLRWLVLTFDSEISDEGLTNLLADFNKLKNKSVPRYLNKCYQPDMQPWLCVYGLRKRESFNRNLPCYDLNTLLLYLDDAGKPLFDSDLLIKNIYAAASKLAKETIAIPLDIYNNRLDSTKPALQFAYYLANQVNPKSLKAFVKKTNDAYILSQWATIPKSLNSKIKDLKNDLPGGSLSDVKQLLNDGKSSKFVESVSNDKRKVIAKLNPDSAATFHQSFIQEWEAHNT